jgi:dynein heavy chain
MHHQLFFSSDITATMPPSLSLSLPAVTRFTSPDGITEPAPLGVYIHGVVLEGARWDREEGVLKESNPSELHPALPVIQVRCSSLFLQESVKVIA